MPKFEVLEGKHSEGDKLYVKGDIVTSVRALDEVFVNKFRKLITEEDVAKDKALAKASEATPKKEEKPEDAPKDARGKEVTTAHKAPKGLKVFKRGDSYHVYEEDDTAPINKKALAKDEVKAFIAKYLEK